MPLYEIAELNIAQSDHPLDSPPLADFVNNLDRINALAESADGFVWRLKNEDMSPGDDEYFGKNVVINLSVWESIEHLHHYVYYTAHKEIMRRKSEWFEKMHSAHMVLWWIEKGHTPTLEEADARLQMLRKNGPTNTAFTFKRSFPSESV